MVRVSYEDAGQVCTYFGWGLVQWECCCLGQVFGFLMVRFFCIFCLGFSVFGAVCVALGDVGRCGYCWPWGVFGGCSGVMLLGVVCMGVSEGEGQVGLRGGHSLLGCVV